MIKKLIFGLLFIPMFSIGQNTHIPDTLWVPGCEYLFEADASTFILNNIPGSRRMVVSTDADRMVVVDENLMPVARSPLFSFIDYKQVYYRSGFIAITDSFWLAADAYYQAFAKPPMNTNGCDEVLLPMEYLAKPLVKNKTFRLGQLQSPFIRSTGSGMWEMYLPVRMLFPKPGEVSSDRIEPYAVFCIERVKKHWKVYKKGISVQGFPVDDAIRVHDFLYGFTSLTWRDNKIWCSSSFSSYAYAYSLEGIIEDSVKLSSTMVNDKLIYRPSSYKKADAHQMLRVTNQYYGLWASNDWMLRNVYIAPGQTQRFIVYDFSKQETHEFDAPNRFGVTAMYGDKAFFTGVRRGDRIGFPYLNLTKLLSD